MRRGAALVLALGLAVPLSPSLTAPAQAQGLERLAAPVQVQRSEPVGMSGQGLSLIAPGQGVAGRHPSARASGTGPLAAPLARVSGGEATDPPASGLGLFAASRERERGLAMAPVGAPRMGLQAAPEGRGPDPVAGLEAFGTAMKYALPLAAAVCAADQDRLEDFAVRGALQAAVVLGLKTLFDDSPRGRRPSGEGRGFPSGHAAAAGFGAADLAGKCWRDEPGPGAVAYGAAGLTAVSRVQAGQHTPGQAWAGSLIGIGFGAASLGLGSEGASISFGLRF